MVSAAQTDEGGWERRKQEKNKCSRFGFQFPVASVGSVSSVSSVSSAFRRITGSLWVLAVSPSLLIVGYYIHIYNMQGNVYIFPSRYSIWCESSVTSSFMLNTHTHSLSLIYFLLFNSIQFNSIQFYSQLWPTYGWEMEGRWLISMLPRALWTRGKKKQKKVKRSQIPNKSFKGPKAKPHFFSP